LAIERLERLLEIGDKLAIVSGDLGERLGSGIGGSQGLGIQPQPQRHRDEVKQSSSQKDLIDRKFAIAT
jgi:hypothetical protein